MLVFDETNRQWADEVFQRIESKMEITVRRSTGIIPYRTENGRFENMAEKNICWWTNGFWEGLLWLLYDRTNKDLYRTYQYTTIEGRKDKLELFELFVSLYANIPVSVV